MRENFRQLKFAYDKQGDKINEAFFYGLEMNAYNATLKSKWWAITTEIFWQKLILYLSDILSKYGSSFLRPLLGILLSTLLMFIVLICFYDYKDLLIDFSKDIDYNELSRAIGEYWALINPIHKIDKKLSGWAIMWDLISRILSSYFIYSLIRATRRFLK